MCDRNASPPSSSSSSAAAVSRRRSRHSAEEEVGCTGRSCQSCTAGVIADCVAVCCCPCAVVNIFTLAFVKLPWAVARRCIGRRRERRRRLEEERRKRGGGGVDGATTSEIVVNIGEELLNDEFGAELKGEEVWLELYELGHLGFGRVSFTGIPFQDKGD
ncbi:hypothetical protein SASPL_125506 [Salvia splendens]|uniref:Uncharacterized protein n=1 Tax=Salvia splendens TaxID=180675 RepID=A0A8X8XDX2_SALSN|nr:uncharacterized protein LOC121749107 [Salvia splendens]KAG6412815.1 hypothetical protein SASPL_125506 [Salvia splendens]